MQSATPFGAPEGVRTGAPRAQVPALYAPSGAPRGQGAKGGRARLLGRGNETRSIRATRLYNHRMVTKAELEAELHRAMRSGDEPRKRTMRMLLSAVKLAEVEKRGALDDAGMQAVRQKEVKVRHEAIADAEKANRDDLAQASQAELVILQAYLPEPLAPAELERLAREAIAAASASGPQDMGKVMRELMPRVQGRADGKDVSDVVRGLLSAS